LAAKLLQRNACLIAVSRFERKRSSFEKIFLINFTTMANVIKQPLRLPLAPAFARSARETRRHSIRDWLRSPDIVHAIVD
jgi:hypothetical protein